MIASTNEGERSCRYRWIPLEMWQEQGIEAKMITLSAELTLNGKERSVTLKKMKKQ